MNCNLFYCSPIDSPTGYVALSFDINLIISYVTSKAVLHCYLHFCLPIPFPPGMLLLLSRRLSSFKSASPTRKLSRGWRGRWSLRTQGPTVVFLVDYRLLPMNPSYQLLPLCFGPLVAYQPTSMNP